MLKHKIQIEDAPGSRRGAVWNCRPRYAKRGTIMVFVLGVLTLLALIGLVLITRTQGEARRMTLDASAASSRSVTNLMVRTIQETLRRDIWGPNPVDPNNPSTLGKFPRPLDGNGSGIMGENNEPYDAPGDSDKWLATTTPYMLFDLVTGSPTYGQAKRVEPFTGADPLTQHEAQVLIWRRLSYIGTDLTANVPLQPFGWAANSRYPALGPVRYADTLLQDARILHTPPPAYAGRTFIPGSTTNVTIAQAQAEWNSSAAALAVAFPGEVPRFPYFDTNADGELDLYDADGDGVPDSPLSMVIPVESADPNRPRSLYAAVRVVDHGSMLNVNVASANLQPSGAPTFDESLAGLQRRGRRQTELLVDEVLHGTDVGARAADMVSYRDNTATPDPVAYDVDVVRRILAGGTLAGSGYRPYGVSDESSLRHRGTLIPYDRRKETLYTGYENIDRALPGTLQWSRLLNGSAYDVDASAGKMPRWTRLNSNFTALTTGYEGFDDANGAGWRRLLTEDDPVALRRHMLTTMSSEVQVTPDITTPNVPIVVAPVAGETALDHRLRQLWALGMDWPVYIPAGTTLAGDPLRPANSFSDQFLISPNVMPPEWARTLPIDLNMRSASAAPADVADAKISFIRYMAAAMYLSMPRDNLATAPPNCPPLPGQEIASIEGVYQGQLCDDHPCTPVAVTDESLNREYMAWQFAINAADYRDNDNTPTIWQPWPTAFPNVLIYGVEKQPFFTEAFAYLTVGSGAGPPGPGPSSSFSGGDEWFFAVELFVPPYWDIATSNLYIRSPGAVGPTVDFLQPLSAFTRVFGGQPPILSGGPTGQYVVLCGSLTAPPTGLDTTGFYRHPGFRMPVDGDGYVELVWSPTGNMADQTTHVLDVMRPRDTFNGTQPNRVVTPGDGDGVWAKNPGSLTPGSRRAFSMLRCTEGWRFTSAYQVYSQAPAASAGGQPMRRSLGLPNNTSGNLNSLMPESIWPTRTALNGNISPDPFSPDQPYATFDNVADIDRVPLVGPVRPVLGAPPYFTFASAYGSIGLPATSFMAEILATTDGKSADLPDGAASRIAAGRVDFDRAVPGGSGNPWTWRLASYLTTQDMLFDNIDNDGDGNIDLADITEGYDVLHRAAGRININTAPVSVLRSVPFMSLLPTSIEFLSRGFGSGDPAADYLNPANTGVFWDMATAILAAREERAVPLRLPDSLGVMQGPVAIAELDGSGPRPDYAVGGAFKSVAELAKIDQLIDTSIYGNDSMFRVDRFVFRPNDPLYVMSSHKTLVSDPDLGTPSSLSPDYRFRRADNNGNGNFNLGEGDDFVADFVPITTGVESGGLRGRDVLLSRWANLLTVRSDVFTAYIALIDENGNYVSRSQVTLDRSNCFRSPPGSGAAGVVMDQGTLPRIVTRTDGAYAESVN